jgi:hypothetical protein
MVHLFIYLLLQVNQQRKQNKLEGMGRKQPWWARKMPNSGLSNPK